MRRILLLFTSSCGLILFPSRLLLPVAAIDKIPPKAKSISQIRLQIPKDRAEKNYLGISGEGYFKVSQIKAGIVIIEIFSLYCPYCQSSAPEVNALYRMIEQIPDLKDRIKMIGIGAGNSALEVDAFKEKYKVPFPLFPDEDFRIHEDLGGVRTPYFIVIKIKKDRTLEIVHSQEGAFGEAETFLQGILKWSALK
jgi:peroxiredoxin